MSTGVFFDENTFGRTTPSLPATSKSGAMIQHKKAARKIPDGFNLRAGNETRTRDPQLGKLMLYQLSYSRRVL